MRPIYSFRPERKRSEIADITLLSGWMKRMLNEGIDYSIGRSNRWHSIACDFGMAGFEYEDVEDFLDKYFEPESDFPLSEWKTTLKSGYKLSQRKK
jgi:hypothetical protein